MSLLHSVHVPPVLQDRLPNQVQKGLPPSPPKLHGPPCPGMFWGLPGALASWEEAGGGWEGKAKREGVEERRGGGEAHVCAGWKGSRGGGAPCPSAAGGWEGGSGEGPPGRWGTASQRSPGGRAAFASWLSNSYKLCGFRQMTQPLCFQGFICRLKIE